MLVDPTQGGSEKFPSTLFHYTTQAGLLGILKNRFLYATHIRYLNDSREYEYAAKLARDFFEALTKSGTPDEKTLATDVLQSLDILNFLAPHVCSFCKDGDRLSLWRGYCRENSGIALGFSTDGLKKVADDRFKLVRCVYQPEDQRAMLSALVESYVSQRRVPDDISEFLVLLITCFAAMKHPSFQEEEEYRLVSQRHPRNQYRPGKSFLIPFMEFPLAVQADRMPLSCAIVGPSPHLEFFRKSVEQALGEAGSPIPVKSSNVPYRDW
jgi:hypothetical protein